jgi:hypothetical protein
MSWGFRSLVTTKNDLKCATHFQGLCVCVHLGEGHPHFERVLDMPDVDFTWRVFVRMSIRHSQVKWVKNAGWDSTGVMAVQDGMNMTD